MSGIQAVVHGCGVMFSSQMPLSLQDTFSCGQAFRFLPEKSGGYSGIAFGRRITLTPCENGWFYLSPCTLKEFSNIWAPYLDLERDYRAVMQALEWDAYVRRGMDFAPGIRILNQDPFETLISFIVSANNNILRIRQILSRMAERWGEAIAGGFAFPSPEALARCEEAELRAIGAGYRAGYIIEASRAVEEGFDLSSLADMDLDSARRRLCTVKGVGPKVADCILMFSLGHRGAFPVDTWVRKVLIKLYPSCDLRHPQRFAQQRYGDYAGYANQYLFHCIRSKGESAFFSELQI